MGVIYLWSYLNARRETFFEKVDLIKVAKSRPNGIHILVDFYSWEHYMKSAFSETTSVLFGHPYLDFDGGEYKLFDSFIRNFIQVLRSVGIELVFYLDGAKGSSAFATEQKWATWKGRHFQEQKRARQVMDHLRGKIPLSSLDLKVLTRPCLQEIQNLLTLQSLGCSLNQCVAGEADSFLAQHLLRDEKAFAVFSNDSDFCIFPGSVLLHNDFFDLENDLGLGASALSIKVPDKIMCEIVSAERLWKHFGFPGVEYLTELSIIRGNDFTRPFLKDVIPRSSCEKRRINELAQLVKQYGKAERCPLYDKLIAGNAALQEAVHHSRKFYAMQLGEEISDTGHQTFRIILEKVRQCVFPSSIISMWKSFYWHRQIMEEAFDTLRSAEEALVPLRSQVYTILLPEDRWAVMEYGRSHRRLFDEMQVFKAEDKNIPSLPVVNQNSFHENLLVFEHILSHQEPFPNRLGRSYCQQYGIQKGFICYLLRYFLLLNWQKNLDIRPREFLTLCAWVMGQHDSQHHRKMKIVPSPRCVTIETWFLLLFRLSYAFLGNVLNLSHAFPTPADLFSGATWVALYTSIAVTDPNPAVAEPLPLSVPREEFFRLSQHVFTTTSQHSQIVSTLVENVFELGLQPEEVRSTPASIGGWR